MANTTMERTRYDLSNVVARGKTVFIQRENEEGFPVLENTIEHYAKVLGGFLEFMYRRDEDGAVKNDVLRLYTKMRSCRPEMVPLLNRSIKEEVMKHLVPRDEAERLVDELDSEYVAKQRKMKSITEMLPFQAPQTLDERMSTYTATGTNNGERPGKRSVVLLGLL